ncbi:MAG TPA: lipocalin family protein [Caulobacteraceae bacterium]|jgi:apolipoprotein D and lipocalin family protein|nr:lipocalin family protein [Caulobacteraceae bacterium]
MIRLLAAPLAALVAAVMPAAPVLARTAAPPPARPVPASLYSGRWYELARTPNARQRGCEAPWSEFQAFDGRSFTLRESCRQGSIGGRERLFTTRAAIVPGTASEKFKMSFLGGLVHQEFWILDRADDGSWAIMATPGGNYVWLLCRRASLSPPALASLVGRLKGLGYANLEFPQQPRQ